MLTSFLLRAEQDLVLRQMRPLQPIESGTDLLQVVDDLEGRVDRAPNVKLASDNGVHLESRLVGERVDPAL